MHTVTAYSTAGLLPTLGVSPLMGRTFTPDEDQKGDPHVMVLSYALWKSNFGGDPDIVGKSVTADAIAATIVGVMPPGFDFPGHGVELWMPLCLDPTDKNRGAHFLSVIGRTKPGVSLGQARGELASLVETWDTTGGTQHRLSAKVHPMVLRDLQGEIVGPVSWMLWLLQGAVLLVLVIACMNVSSLLLARAEARGKEIAIRTALGAGRGRLARMFLVESGLLGILGGVLGVLFAMWGIDAMVAIIPDGAPRTGEITMNAGVLAFGLGSALLTSFVFGLAPIVHARHGQLDAALRAGGTRSTGSSGRLRCRRALVVGQVSLAVILVIACGLTARSFVALSHVDTGFQPDGLLTMQLEIPTKTYSTSEALLGYWQSLTTRLDQLPGVVSATEMSGLPPNRQINADDFAIVGRPPPSQGPGPSVDYVQSVGADYFKTMGIQLVSGRVFGAGDTRLGLPAVIVNQELVRKFFPGEDPIGKQIRYALDDPQPAQTIVGVVTDVKQQGLENQAGTEIYFPLEQRPHGVPILLNVVVRTDGDPAALVGSVSAAISQIDATIPIARVRTMDSVLWDSVARPRFLALLLAIFAGLALVLAAIGIYGVMAFAVAQRTQELGIRMALGARAGNVVALVMRQGMALAAIGVGLGLVATVGLNLALGGAFTALLFKVKALDPATFAAVAIAVAVVAGFASWIPARRATRVDPMVALRRD